jgi:hypothetical protein
VCTRRIARVRPSTRPFGVSFRQVHWCNLAGPTVIHTLVAGNLFVHDDVKAFVR